MFKCHENKSNNEFCEILKCFRKTAKFQFFMIHTRNPQITRFKMTYDMFMF